MYRRLVVLMILMSAFLTNPAQSEENGLLCCQDQSNPWTWLLGKWQMKDDSGAEAEVVWKKVENAEAVLGEWTFPDGKKATEIVGWQPLRKMMVATAYGADGQFWNLEGTTVTASKIEGPIWTQGALGGEFVGMFQLVKVNNDRVARLYTGFDNNGQAVTVRGFFTRVK